LQLQEKSTEDQKQLDLYGKAVFVGFSERLRPAQKDGFYTVFSQANGVDISGVEIAATAFANLLEDMPIRPLAVHAQLIMIFLWGLVLGVGCRLLPTVIAAVSALGLGALYLIAVQQQFMTVGSWYPLIIPVCFQMPLAFFGTVLWKYFDTSKERHNIRKALGYYLPNQVIEQLSKNVADARTNNQLVYGTCLFTDAGQYTSLAETMEPAALGSFMNQYFEVIFEPVQRHGGSVSDVVGDSVPRHGIRLAWRRSLFPAPYSASSKRRILCICRPALACIPDPYCSALLVLLATMNTVPSGISSMRRQG
jgi:adenylate cyclase